MNKKNYPELLAPAGSLEAAIVAFDCGADAVYAGFEKFNARERGKNFSRTELSQLIAYARKIDKKVYVVVNTLIKECELAAMAELLTELVLLKPDAVIVQDLGVLRMIREYFPQLEIHASTQMGIHNSAGVNMVAQMGVKRVILQRQVTGTELRNIKKHSNIEVECFVHGALCCSQSGKCLFSSWMGGWSGNRGKCKQPCRRRFYSSRGNGFFFSANDLSLLEHIPELCAMGIDSVKVEGRLRDADYVSSVIKAYRLVLDAVDTPRLALEIGRAKKILTGSLGRKWSDGFWNKREFNKIIQHDSLGCSGLLCGKVKWANGGGIMVELNRNIEVGDRVRIQPTSGDEGIGFTITKMSVKRKNVKKAFAKESCYICCDKDLPDDGLFYKVGIETKDMSERISKLKSYGAGLDLNISLNQSGVEIKINNMPMDDWKFAWHLEKAEKSSCKAEEVCNELRKGSSEQFFAANINVEFAEELFVPRSVMKNIRLEFWQWIQENLSFDFIQSQSATPLIRLQQDLKKRLPTKGIEKSKTIYPTIIHKNPVTGKRTKKTTLKSVFVVPLKNYKKGEYEVILPEFCVQGNLAGFKEKLAGVLKKGAKRFRVTSLYQISILRELAGEEFAKLTLTAFYPLPVCNSLAMEELLSLGLMRANAWVELDKEAIQKLYERCGKRLEQWVYGRVPLMATRAILPASGRITDARGQEFIIRKDGELNKVYAKRVFSVVGLDGISLYLDFCSANPGEKDLYEFNYQGEFC